MNLASFTQLGIPGAGEDRLGRAAPLPTGLGRFRTSGKFFARGGLLDTTYLRGVTYGPFRPGPDGCVYHDRATVERDFDLAVTGGINCVRTYTVPPAWLLDAAGERGIGVLVGVPWAQYVGFLDRRDLIRDAHTEVRRATQVCRGHSAVLGYAVGNEIPAMTVRYYGHRRIEQFVRGLYDTAKWADPEAAVTYANYPSTEYLDLPFLDFVSFNIYLDAPEKLRSYLHRLQNIAADRPLIVSELGIDSRSHGDAAQAAALAWQVRTAFDAGCAGTFVFSFTDEWHRHGQDVVDWKFGLVDEHRSPKPAFESLRRAYAQVPFADGADAHTTQRWPRVSVVVCTYNGGRTIGRTIDAALKIDYPDYEILVIDDGSRDNAAEVVSAFLSDSRLKLIRTQNRGLSAARNTGLELSTGEIVAYIDDDAFPDRNWLRYLVRTLDADGVAGAGGPNLGVPGDPLTAECVAHAPGGPTHVLLSDTVAEHLPGCNMAFWKQPLVDIGGFDPRYRIAGDDVDLCWRLQQRGWTLCFSPAAQVWHHRRASVRAFWRQQVNYGKAEAELERQWPEKYNAAGHATWSGRMYGKGTFQVLLGTRRRIYHGVWGVALFQQACHVPPSVIWSVPMMPEWYLILAVLGCLSMLGVFWWPLLGALPVLGAMVAFSTGAAAGDARRATASDHGTTFGRRLRKRALIVLLTRLQPMARLVGRSLLGRHPVRSRGVRGFALPVPTTVEAAAKHWRIAPDWLGDLERRLARRGGIVLRGGDFDPWDLELRGGLLGEVRISLMLEDLGDNAQLLRCRLVPRASTLATWGTLAVLVLASAAIVAAPAYVAAGFIAIAALHLILTVRQAGACLRTARGEFLQLTRPAEVTDATPVAVADSTGTKDAPAPLATT